ncbi:hypothetical protein [Gluconobacter morbifer]|uniref:Secreted protein n=1 Tax=Gluconobacter morbifer G707 TaxID=1088869 RepID=G6XJ54_9PROT|nr:hypothetical protein [Gluconobacter morbifer]EHH68170.1 hypothetical protein GMO_15200 [Gluconobacter morbifer G707]
MVRLKHLAGFVMMAGLVAAAPRVCLAAGYQGQSACWTANPGEDDRPDISCQPLDEATLRKLENATPAQVTALFKVPGKNHHPTYFESADKSPGHFNGYVELMYTDGHVTSISASVTQVQPDGLPSDPMDFRWKVGGQECSDFSGSRNRCTNGDE